MPCSKLACSCKYLSTHAWDVQVLSKARSVGKLDSEGAQNIVSMLESRVTQLTADLGEKVQQIEVRSLRSVIGLKQLQCSLQIANM